MTRIITDTTAPRAPFVECHHDDCAAVHVLSIDPSDWTPARVYADLEAGHWSTDPAFCPEHRPDLYDSLSEADRRAVVQYVIDQGRYLAGEDDWSMEDNFSTTEGLAEVYSKHVAHDVREG